MSLSDGDEFRIGPAILVFCAPGEGSTRTREVATIRRKLAEGWRGPVLLSGSKTLLPGEKSRPLP